MHQICCANAINLYYNIAKISSVINVLDMSLVKPLATIRVFFVLHPYALGIFIGRNLKKTLVITTVFVTKDFAIKSNLLLKET